MISLPEYIAFPGIASIAKQVFQLHVMTANGHLVTQPQRERCPPL